jgi:hypothetical protein
VYIRLECMWTYYWSECGCGGADVGAGVALVLALVLVLQSATSRNSTCRREGLAPVQETQTACSLPKKRLEE